MVKAVSIVIMVLCGIGGGWIGYWIGHAAGWSVNAEWPGQIGGGTGAILMSMGMSMLFVALAAVAVRVDPDVPRHVALDETLPRAA